ncbi:MAG: KamA family radical SAM protein [Rhodobacterales bacterium]|nr:KamA family radical SAM protein [Rhodobacterales bacterium]
MSKRKSASGPVVGRPEILLDRPELADIWAETDAQFPIRVTRSWWQRINHADVTDPLLIQALPQPAELLADPDDREDPVGDAACSPLPWVVHKYPSRVLLLLTKRCHLYCRYCFRRNHRPSEREDPTPGEWAAALDYALGSGAEEVILSGGDPLAVRDQTLFDAIDTLRDTIPVIRIHTRAPITKPARVTNALVAGLASRRPVWVVVHCNHPKELSPDVDQALARLIDAGLPVLNQSVLLRGVNDNVPALAELSRQLVRRGVFPYYLHHTDHAGGNAHFRVGVQEGLALWHGLQKCVSGGALPRYVIDPPQGSGKVDVASWVSSPT